MPVDNDRVEEEAQTTDAKKRQAIQVTVILAILLSASILLLAGTATYAVVEGRSVNEKLCKSSQEQRRALRELIQYVRDRALSLADSDTDFEAIQAEYREILRIVPPIQCSDGQVERRDND